MSAGRRTGPGGARGGRGRGRGGRGGGGGAPEALMPWEVARGQDFSEQVVVGTPGMVKVC
jgi:hypothetical protein